MKIQCPNCHYEGKPVIRNRGSCFLLLFLFFFFIIPAIFYLFYMGTGRIVSCPRCGNRFVIRQ